MSMYTYARQTILFVPVRFPAFMINRLIYFREGTSSLFKFFHYVYHLTPN